MQTGALRLAHGWKLIPGASVSQPLVREFIRPAVRAVPFAMARRLGECRISLSSEGEPGIASQWTITRTGLSVSVVTADLDEHDIAMELLICMGQALWARLSDAEVRAYWAILHDEIQAGIEGEIDERSLEDKRRLLDTRPLEDREELLMQYGRASFAGTAAEYVHSLWHDVSIRQGPDYLPPETLRRRLELLARWFPPDRGHRLFPTRRRRADE